MSGPRRRGRRIRSPGRAVRRLRRVPAGDWPAVLATVAVAVLVEVGLRTMRLPTLARLAGAPLGGVPAGEAPAASPSGATGTAPSGSYVLADLPAGAVRRLRIAASVMRYWPFDEKCLRQSLVCGHRIRSLAPSLVVGVAIVEGEVRAHAWLTVDGTSLDPWAPASFAEVTSASPRRAPAAPR